MNQLGFFDDAPAPPPAPTSSSAPSIESAKQEVPRFDPGPPTPNKMHGKSDRKIGFATAAQKSARELYQQYRERYQPLDGEPW